MICCEWLKGDCFRKVMGGSGYGYGSGRVLEGGIFDCAPLHIDR